MSFKISAAVAALMTAIAAPAPAWAFGFPGCPNLPEYARALGALQGLSTCGMTVEEARRVVAAHDGLSVAPRQAVPLPQTYHPRHQRPPHHRTVRSRRDAAR